MTNKSYYEVSIEYPNGYIEKLLTSEIKIETGYDDRFDDEFRYVHFDRVPAYLGPRTTEIKYKNLWGATVLMQIPSDAVVRYHVYTGDVWWVEKEGKRVSPIWDEVSEVYNNRFFHDGEIVVKEFVKKEENES